MGKIVVLDGVTANPGDLSWQALEEFGSLEVYPRTAAAETVARVGNAEAVFTNKVVFTRDVMAACPSLSYIGETATGYNNIDVKAARELGITVCNVPAYSTMSVAQFTIGLLLEVCHHFGAHDRAVHEGKWQKSLDYCFWDYPLFELDGKTLGIIGFGRIGQRVAKIAQTLGMKILAHARTKHPELENADCRYASLDEVLSKSDVVSLHCPLFPETEGLINSAAIAKMKPGALLLNTSRGQVIVEADVAAALNEGRLGAYAADVVSAEPIKADNPLLSAKNCILTPHIAWASKECRERLLDIAINNYRQFRAGRPVNVVS